MRDLARKNRSPKTNIRPRLVVYAIVKHDFSKKQPKDTIECATRVKAVADSLVPELMEKRVTGKDFCWYEAKEIELK